jgi:glycosyltransferase involved in cell wall biosynthesis
MTGENIVAIIAAALSGWRGQLVVSERTSLQRTLAETGFWRSWILWGLMRLLYRRADRVVAVSQQLANDMVTQLDLPAQKVVAIPNPVPIEEIRRMSMVPVSHRFFSEGVPVLMAVGRLHSVKDYPTLVQAVADLRERRDVRLIVLGEGPARSELEALVKSLGLSEVVDLPGFVSPPWPWMARADVLALSSRAEGWPNVLAEALALGVPVVSTDCPTGPREILDGGKFGRLVPVGDVGKMSAAIEATLDNPPDGGALRRRAEEWSPGRVLQAYLSCINLRAQGTA